MKQLTVLSYGGGQDSKTILMKLIHDAAFRARYAPDALVVVMSDTGDEHPHTIQDLVEVRKLCAQHKIDFHHLTKDMGYHVASWPDLISPQLRTSGGQFKATLVQLGSKTCTLQLKIGPIYKFLDEYINEKCGYGFKIQKGRGCLKQAITRYGEEYGSIRVLIGFAAGEESRAEKSKKQEERDQTKPGFWKHIRREFPLIDLGMDRKSCQAYIASVGASVPFPSNCMRCPYMSAEELLWLFIHHEEKFVEWEQIEAAKLARFAGQDKNHGVFNSKQTLRQKLEKVQAKYAHLSAQALNAFLTDYKMNHGCGKGTH